MKQRLSVRAIINEDGKALLLRRNNGRDSILGKYELPGGKLAYGEQPEDALRRYLHDDAGLHVQSAQLFDAVTYIDYDDRAIQYGVIVYLVTLAPQRHQMKLSGNYSKYKWHTMLNVQQSELTDLTQLLLGIIQQEQLTDITLAKIKSNDEKNATSDTVTIFSDGGSRGNPGPSAGGFVIINNRQEVIAEGGEYIGITTNSQAEYQGVRLGLEEAEKLGYKKIDFKVDSMMVVNQMKGYYKIKNRELWPIHERILTLMKKFDRVTFTHVPRQFNQLADGMVNKTLDAHKREKSIEASNS
ncbi:MAG: fructose-2,6-bisphosphatase, putative phosphoglycerate mutase [Candidatus Saccharibacteria bacterium]|nr:fructose-2,6-bisphosphatase, putative phosphoglycerate mutase [Candidatus Saccharibacteria bacterium]MDB5180829.1 fructose-2,6-bisphosphatase, putative phosphoglycerate mutase [Candidatus Saccharibacteria bacterium]